MKNIPDLVPADVISATSSGNPEADVDNLDAMVLRLRQNLARLPMDTSATLIQSLPKIQDPLGVVAVWEALEFSLPFHDLFTAGIEWIEEFRNPARAQALGTLLSVFPEQRDLLISRFQNETNQFMRYEMARAHIADQPHIAWEKLCQLVQSESDLALELEELIPEDLAAVSEDINLPFLEAQADRDNKTNVWRNTIRILAERSTGYDE